MTEKNNITCTWLTVRQRIQNCFVDRTQASMKNPEDQTLLDISLMYSYLDIILNVLHEKGLIDHKDNILPIFLKDINNDKNKN